MRIGLGGCAAIAAVAAAGSALPARADGAFPDELQVFLPSDHPSRIILAANFGLLESEDDGVTWSFVCEAQAAVQGNINLYELSSQGTLIGIALALTRSTNEGCGWGPVGGTLATAYAWDMAFDPVDPPLALALSATDAGQVSGIFPSYDDGQTWGPYVLSMVGNLRGVEFAQSSPGLVYLTGNQVAAPDAGYIGTPFIFSGFAGLDGGTRFGQPILHPELAIASGGTPDGGDAGPPATQLPGTLLAAVDPVDSQTVYLRLQYTDHDVLAVTHDSGKTITPLFSPPEPMTAFLVSSTGTLYLGTRNGTGHGGLFAAPPAADGGFPTFTVVTELCPDGGTCDVHIRCLGERDGALYACGDNWQDEFALGRSTNGGTSFTGLIQFVQIGGLAACPGTDIEATCGTTFCSLAQLFLIDAGSCEPKKPGTDAGGTVSTNSSSGCGSGCGTAEGGAALLGVLMLLGLRWRRRP